MKDKLIKLLIDYRNECHEGDKFNLTDDYSDQLLELFPKVRSFTHNPPTSPEYILVYLKNGQVHEALYDDLMDKDAQIKIDDNYYCSVGDVMGYIKLDEMKKLFDTGKTK